MNADVTLLADLQDCLRQGDDHPVSRLFRDYSRRLLALARNRLDARTRRKIDPEDVVQTVFRTVVRRYDAGELDLSDADSTWSLLALITVCKCANQDRH